MSNVWCGNTDAFESREIIHPEVTLMEKKLNFDLLDHFNIARARGMCVRVSQLQASPDQVWGHSPFFQFLPITWLFFHLSIFLNPFLTQKFSYRGTIAKNRGCGFHPRLQILFLVPDLKVDFKIFSTFYSLARQPFLIQSTHNGILHLLECRCTVLIYDTIQQIRGMHWK